jgi:hypothetical protein
MVDPEHLLFRNCDEYVDRQLAKSTVMSRPVQVNFY